MIRSILLLSPILILPQQGTIWLLYLPLLRLVRMVFVTLLRDAADGLVLPLSLIFHRGYQEGIVPASLHMATLIPVYKERVPAGSCKLSANQLYVRHL